MVIAVVSVIDFSIIGDKVLLTNIFCELGNGILDVVGCCVVFDCKV